MKIAFDLRPLQIGHQNRGIGAYILNVMKEIPSKDSDTFIFLRYDSSNPIKDYLLAEDLTYKEVVLKRRRFSRHPGELLGYIYSGLFPNYHKLNRLRPDVFIQFDYLLGAPRTLHCKVITVAYDLIPLKFKQLYLPSWKKYIGYRNLRTRSRLRLMLHAWFYDKKYKAGLRLLRRSDRVISISKNTTHDLITMANVSSKKITTIYLAASFRKSSRDVDPRSEVIDLVDSLDIPYIVYVGATDKRRQVDELIYAFNLFNAREKPIALILAGNEFTENSKLLNPKARHAIETSSYKSNIHMLGKISETEKRYLLEHATTFVYPTLYEGFGLPILEAMEAGCPVITYNNSSIPEIADSAALYVDTYGGYSIYKSLCELVGNDQLAEKLSTKGRAQAKKFDWQDTSNRVWNEIRQLKRGS